MLIACERCKHQFMVEWSSAASVPRRCAADSNTSRRSAAQGSLVGSCSESDPGWTAEWRITKTDENKKQKEKKSKRTTTTKPTTETMRTTKTRIPAAGPLRAYSGCSSVVSSS